MRVLFSILMLLLIPLATISQKWHTDYNTALSAAKEKQLPLLIYFSGSDWCAPCMKLSKIVFETEEFAKFSKDSLTLLNIDFPKRASNQPNEKDIAVREKLAERFNPNGTFPLVVLLSPDEEKIASTGYQKLAANGYIQHLKKLLNNFQFPSNSPARIYRTSSIKMGSKFEIAAIHPEVTKAQNAVDQASIEIDRIEQLISSWKLESETTRINNNAGIQAVPVSKELFQLIKRCKKISQLTNGAFDISFNVFSPFWHFDGSMTELPDSSLIAQSIKLVDYTKIILNDSLQTVFLKDKGMSIGFGAIGKGYAANRAKAVMQEHGIENGMINAGGDLIAWGEQALDKKWKIGIADPTKQKEFVSWLELNNQAVVTSGDYEKYATINGQRYAHIIDPRTGYPTTGIKSVTIVCPDTELADALATAIFVMGTKKGLSLINQMKEIECLIITDKNEMISSKGIDLIKSNEP